ncbi:UNVERIFIED_CONTAM: hypothetical protein PYX00_002629 [Menopon gallinae]|uniref:Uncharacterized protein n=1 Tax=Menopon gallinae TaxID=328185 RepID=A0AAW2HWW9_9NEOP
MMSENSGVDVAALRREARRRRILANSEDRLRSITGKIASSEEEPMPDTCLRTYLDESNIERPIPSLQESISEKSDADIDFTELPRYLRNYLYFKRKRREENSYIKLIIRMRFHYIILSIIAQLLYLFNLGFLFYNNLFCPFITMKAMELLFIRDLVHNQEVNCLRLLASLLRGSMLSNAIQAFSVATNIISDFLLYIFSFVLSYKLLNGIKETYYI